MASLDVSTPRCVQDSCAKNTFITRLWRRLTHRWNQRKHPRVPHMNAHLARDIGLSQHELARRNHQWPSQTMHHPRG